MKNKFINYLKETELYNEEVFEFIKPKTIQLDHSEESSVFYGVFPIVDDNNKVKDIRLCVPKIKDDITVSINIHEYVHLLLVYRNLNNEYKESEYDELLPIIYQLYYLKDNDPEYLEEFREKISKSDNKVLKQYIKNK